MCAALVLVALLGVLALHLLNEVRSGQYRERLAHGPQPASARPWVHNSCKNRDAPASAA